MDYSSTRRYLSHTTVQWNQADTYISVDHLAWEPDDRRQSFGKDQLFGKYPQSQNNIIRIINISLITENWQTQ